MTRWILTRASCFSSPWRGRGNLFVFHGGGGATKYSLGRDARDWRDQLRSPAHPFRVTVIMIVGSLKLADIVAPQNLYTFGIAHWFVFTPWAWPGSSCSSLRPWRNPTARRRFAGGGIRKFIAGYFTEYSGFKSRCFSSANTSACLPSAAWASAVSRGWTAPFSFLTWVPSYPRFLCQADGVVLRFHLDSPPRCRGCAWNPSS